MTFVPIPDAVSELRAGRIIIVVDDENRENEGDLTIAAEKVTPEIINFMAAEGRGLICLALTGEHCDRLALPLMSRMNSSRFGTGFCESIDAREGTTTGISAHDRSRTILQALDADCQPADLSRPGHMFPLRARDGGVLVRRGQTEASVDLARLAGLKPAGVICEVMNADGTMSRVPDLLKFCQRHNLVMTSVAELVRYRLAHESWLKSISERRVQTEFGLFRALLFAGALSSDTHLALVRGDIETADEVLVHWHVRCRYSAIGCVECDCARAVRNSLRAISEGGSGVLLQLYESGVSADDGMNCSCKPDAPDADQIAAHILSNLGVRRVRLSGTRSHANGPLAAFGIETIGQLSATR